MALTIDKWTKRSGPTGSSWASTTFRNLRISYCLYGFTVYFNHIAPVQFLPDRTQDDAEGFGIASLPADYLSDVPRMDIDGEAGTVFCYVSCDDYKFWLVNHFMDDLG